MTDILRRAWDALDSFKQAYPENWSEEDEQVLNDLIKADLVADLDPYPDNFVDALRFDTAINEMPEPEAVAWLYKKKDGMHVITDDPDYADGTWLPLFTAPPNKEWVGLTDEDVWELAQKTPDFAETVAAVEAKLKEKNA
jgi:hypothetical protein